ncbi:MAG: helix-turn-helix domain-containing protein [Oscillospiraceae bacterium]|nr:helix-turn-helix domain-containing protein [Oscillospiraceae bacterium]
MAEIINQQIAALRKNKGITQEELAGHLGVTNQTVSKWELAACCPDIQLLPEIADYFDVTIDELFGRDETAKPESSSIESVPWDDDGTLRAVVFIGKKLMKKTDDLSEFTFEYDGEALNIECQCNISCNDVEGGVNAGRDISCNDVGGTANAGRDISCNDVCGNVNSGASLTCNDIDGSVTAGSSISCNDICGNVTAGSTINCGEIDGDISSGE